MNQAGNRVVLDGKESYMIHKPTGRVTRIEVEDGKFMFNVWVPSERKSGKGKEDGRDKNRFAALAEKEEEENGDAEAQVFSWRDEIF